MFFYHKIKGSLEFKTYLVEQLDLDGMTYSLDALVLPAYVINYLCGFL